MTNASTSAPFLLVDTSLALLHYIAWLLKEVGGFRVRATTNAQMALSWLAERRFALVIAEIQPDASGIELLEALAQSDVEPPPFILTGSTFSQEELARISRVGGAETITKPFPPDRLLSCIERSLGTPIRPPWREGSAIAGWREETRGHTVAHVAEVGPFRLVAEPDNFVVVGNNWTSRGGATSTAEAKLAAVATLRAKLFPMLTSEGLDERISLMLARLDALERE